MRQVLKRLNMTHLLYNQYITGTKILDIGGRVTHYKSVLPWLGPLRELDFGIFIAAISTVIKGVSRDSPWNSSAFVMEHDGMTTQSFCSGFPWDKATTEVTAAATRAVFVKLLGGTQQISEMLAQPLRLIRDRNVVAISQDSSGVTVRAFDSSYAISTYTARRVVVATPPHISAAFQYSPPLPPSKQKLLQHLTQGHMIKTVVTYPAAFWRQTGFSGEVVSSSGDPNCPIPPPSPCLPPFPTIHTKTSC
jgi:hypothetical protein